MIRKLGQVTSQSPITQTLDMHYSKIYLTDAFPLPLSKPTPPPTSGRPLP